MWRALLLLCLCTGLLPCSQAEVPHHVKYAPSFPLHQKGHAAPNLTGSYDGTWHQPEPTKDLNDTDGHISLSLVARPSNHSKHMHSVKGELHLGRPLSPSRYTLRGEYDTHTSELLMLAVPVYLGKYVAHSHLNYSRVVPSYERTTQQIQVLLSPPNVTLSPQQSAVLSNRTYFVPELLDPHFSLLRQELKHVHCVSLLRFRVHMDQQPDDYTPRSPEDMVAQHKLAEGELVSVLCNTSVNFTASTREAAAISMRTKWYAVILSVLTVMQLASLIRQMEYTTTQVGVSEVSLYSLAHITYLDFFIGLTHLSIGVLFESTFKAFAIASFMKFSVCALFEMKYLHSVWKAQRPSQPNRSLRCICVNLYFAVFIGIYVLWKLLLVLGPFTLFVMYSFWIPQVVSNVKRNSKKPLQLQFILVNTITRAFPPLYFLGCPFNFMQWPTYPRLLGAWAVFHAALCGVLFLQYYCGPRAFVPAWLLPKRYNYHRPAPARRDIETGHGEDEEHAEDCAICRSEVDPRVPEEYMLTPCDHMFHKSCLSEWMLYKLECPICRGQLPDQ